MKKIFKITIMIMGLGMVIFSIVLFLSKKPTGPVKFVLDREVCDLCGMHIGDIRFAGQIQTVSGQTYFYDDPGDLILAKDKMITPIHAVYFHHLELENVWIPIDEVSFVPVPESPMGFKIGAVFSTNNLPHMKSLEEATITIKLKHDHKKHSH